ncbi:daptide-type RiPP biosynthesis dehydogenase [Arthrobacter sp. fls2-241-R2A-200]|uniref:daptide-type RiPP biosynthesis dehydogenase n=1 Tax=Arthrobacter sp. fls2-241-R2A-200 TaxID=3040281 RepID=UPI002549FF3F|nr:daptide-type RiPP biosynthesis dehydogenase [Arthrobacter sp. fls2-241-R2A-200]
MIADRTWNTRCVILDHGVSAKYVGALTRGRTGLVVDNALPEHRDRLLAGGLKGVPVLGLDAMPVTRETLRTVGHFLHENGLQTVVGLGGGSVLDAVKLAAVFTADPTLADLAEVHAKRSGLLVLPAIRNNEERPKTVLLPSTVGTGAEVSGVACLDTAVGRRLIASPHLSGDVAVLDGGHLATLPRHLVLEGLLEAFLRVAGTLTGSSANRFDDDAYSLMQRIIRLGLRLAHVDAPEMRLAAARLSMETHTGWSLTGRNPYGAKHWYVANELAYVTGVRKMTATATVIGPIWEEIVNGTAAWGDRGRLDELWAAVREVEPTLASNPASGINELRRHWGIAKLPTLREETLMQTSDAAIQSWGGVLPMLRGIDVAQIQHVLRVGTAEGGSRTELAMPEGQPTSGRGEGVST